MMGPNIEKQKALSELLKQLGVKKKDLQENFIKSSGRGGQKVNKSSSAVFIRHLTTGLNVKYGKHRSRELNRFMALRLLAEKIQTHITGTNSTQQQIINKRKKQKQRNRARTKQKYKEESSKAIQKE